MFAFILKWLGGGVLDRLLKTVDNAVDNETQRQSLRAKAVETYIAHEAATRQTAMQSRYFWWVWMLFAGPLGGWWALVMVDTALQFSWSVPDLPLTVKPWAETIFQSIFGSGAAVGAAQAIGAAIQGRR